MTLTWRVGPARDTYLAACGSEQQGLARVWRHDEGWRWSVDMLPNDPEPTIRATRSLATAVEAMTLAEAQVVLWPVLVRDAGW